MSLNLTATDQIIELVTTGTGAVHVVVSFTDTLASVKTAGSQTTIISSATTTTVVSAPAASTTREINNISAEAVASNTITIQKDVAATNIVVIGPLTMTAGQRTEFTSSSGWKRTDSTGVAFPIMANDTFLANISGGVAAPTAVPLTTLAGAGLTGGTGAVLNVGAGTGITVNANDVQISTITADSFFMNNTAGAAVPVAVAGTTVAGAGLTYTTGGVVAVVAGGGASLVVSANDIQRGALTGVITASQDSNTTAFGTAAAKSILANATNATAIPAYLAGSAAFQHLRVNSTNTGLEWAVIGLTDFPTIAAGSFLANITTGTAVPTAVDLATFAGAGLTYTNVTGILAVVAGAGASLVTSANDIQRGALTGAITASQDSNTTAFGVLAAKSVLANATNASAVPAALAGSASFQHLRVNSANTGLEWSVLTSGDFPAGTVPLTGLATQTAETFLGNFTAGVASPTALAGSTVAGAGLTYTTGGILAVGGSTSIISNANDIQRAALSGDITAGLNSNTTAFRTLNGKTVLANATNASAVPTDLTGSAAFQHLRVNSANTGLEWSVLTTGDFPASSVPLTAFPTITADSFFANGTGGAAIPTAIAGATVAGGGLTYTTGGILAVGAGTGLTVNANDVQISSITAKSVFANATNAGAVPSALAGSAAFQHLRVNSGNTGLEWSVLTTGDFPANSVPVTALATIAAKSVLANATNATATPTAFTSSAALQYLRVNSGNTGLEWATGTSLPWTSTTETAAGPFNDYAVPDLSTTRYTLVVAPTVAGTVTFTGFAASGGNVDGYRFAIQASTSPVRVVLSHLSGSSLAANTVATPFEMPFYIQAREMIDIEYRNGDWRPVSNGQYHIQSFTTSGTTNDLALDPETTVLRVDTGSLNWSITGFTGGYQGRRVTIENASNSTTTGTFTHLSGSIAANQLILPGNADMTASRLSAIFEYDITDGFWRMVSNSENRLVEDNFWSGKNEFSGPAMIRESLSFATTAAAGSVSGTVNNFSAGNVTVCSFTPTSNTTLTGIVPPSSQAGEEPVMLVVNKAAAGSGFVLILSHLGGTSSAANQFSLPGGGTQRTLLPQSWCMLWYDSTQTKWLLNYPI